MNYIGQWWVVQEDACGSPLKSVLFPPLSFKKTFLYNAVFPFDQ